MIHPCYYFIHMYIFKPSVALRYLLCVRILDESYNFHTLFTIVLYIALLAFYSGQLSLKYILPFYVSSFNFRCMAFFSLRVEEYTV